MTWHSRGENSECPLVKEDLHAALSYAADHANGHLSWFHRHRDATQAQLGILIAAEILVVRFLPDASVHWSFGSTTMGFLAILSVVIARIGTRNCERAYIAFLEHSHMITKVLFSLFPEGGVSVTKTASTLEIPGETDRLIFVERFFEDSKYSAKEYVDRQLKRHPSRTHRNTLENTRLVLWTLSLFSGLLGVLGAVMLAYT